MFTRHLSTFSPINCRPASGQLATTALFGYEWGGLLIRGKSGSTSGLPGRNPIFFSNIFVVIQGLLHRDQLNLHDASGRFRLRPGLR
jgi:hypothetical protein